MQPGGGYKYNCLIYTQPFTVWTLLPLDVVGLFVSNRGSAAGHDLPAM